MKVQVKDTTPKILLCKIGSFLKNYGMPLMKFSWVWPESFCNLGIRLFTLPEKEVLRAVSKALLE